MGFRNIETARPYRTPALLVFPTSGGEVVQSASLPGTQFESVLFSGQEERASRIQHLDANTVLFIASCHAFLPDYFS